MTIQPVWRRFISRTRFAGGIGFCLLLVLGLVLGQGVARDSLAVTGPVPQAAAPLAAAAATEQALRERAAADGWVQVRVDLRRPAASAQAALEQTAQDLVLGLSAGSYQALPRVAGTASVTLRVNPAGLEQLLTSPLVAGVAAAGPAPMQRAAAGNAHSLFIAADGSVWAWGYNAGGQVGDGSGTDRLNPVRVLTGAAAVTAGAYHSLAVKTDGTLWAWGWNAYGQLGNNTTTSSSLPLQVLTGVAAVAAGGTHTLAVKTDGTLWAWGDNTNGRLGDGTTTQRLLPVQVLDQAGVPLTGVAAVAAGTTYSLAIKTDGTLWAWGYNGNGQLGDGTAIDRWSAVPITVPGAAGVAAVAAGDYHTLALKTDGSLWAWGYNGAGQFGDGTGVSSPSPVSVPTGTAVVAAIAAHGAHSLAIDTNGNALAWGWNLYGQLGDGTLTDRWSPVAVLNSAGAPLTGVVAMAGGSYHSLALLGDGSLSAWGYNANGQLGDGTTTNHGQAGAVVGIGQLPDFVVSSVVLTPGSPPIYSAFSADVTVTNQGTAAGEPGTLQVWANQGSLQPCGAVGDQSTALPRLAAGASQTITFNNLAAGVAGAKTLRAFVDSTCTSQTAEADATNNQTAQPYAVLAPDYVVSGVVLTPASPSANATFEAKVTVTNQGTAAGVPVLLQVWADLATPMGCYGWGNQNATVPALAIGQSYTATFTGLPAGAAGAKTLSAVIDSQCQSDESDETNNQSFTPYTVVPPDFVVSSVVLVPSAPGANTNFVAQVTVTNQGLGAGDPGTLTLWVNQLAVPACGAAGDAAVTVPRLAAGASLTVALGGLPAGAAGTKTLGVFVDSACQSAEADDNNNQFTTGYTVLPADLDLAVTAVALTPRNPIPGGTFDASVTVTNRGSLATAGGETLQVWTDLAVAPACGDVGNQAATLPSLARDASHTVTFTGLTAAAAVGAKTLRAFVDSACAVPETDEANNQSATAYRVAAPAPDFAVSEVALSAHTPRVNGTFDATLQITNRGTAAGVPGTLQVWANQPAGQTCGAVGDQSVALPAPLAAGASQTVSVTGLAAGGLGVQVLRAFVDSTCATAETDETDNQTTTGYPVGTPDMQRLDAGNAHSLSLLPDGSLWAWGYNAGGQLGDTTWASRLTPVRVMTLSGGVPVPLTGVVAVVAGDYHSVALTADGRLWTWGWNGYGQLGDGTNNNQSAAVPILSGVAAVAAGQYHTLALKTDGSLWAWGYNGNGQLGDGTTTDRWSPVQVLTGVASVAAGYGHSLALKTNGSLWAWGYNGYGQLGDGTNLSNPTPAKVLTGVAAVAGGADHTLALKPDGSLWAWGSNNNGQLGLGGGYGSWSPVRVPIGRAVLAVAAGAYDSLALDPNGNLLAWGWNQYGQLGDGTTIDRASPVAVLTGVTAVAGAMYHTLAQRSDGTVWAWGHNGSGQLGDGTGTGRLRPGAVSGFGPLPDFVITAIVVTPGSPSANGPFSATVTVTNQGTAAGNPGTLQVWANQAAVQSCGALGDQAASLPSLAVGASATVTVNGLPAGVSGAKTLLAYVDSACQTLESDHTNNQTSQAYTVVTRTLAITDVTQAEGNSGTTAFAFTVGLSAASLGPVTVNYALAGGTALAGSDYVDARGTLTFAPGETSKTLIVKVIGDTAQEPNETFYVNLSAPSGATLADAQGLGTIINDDIAALAISDVKWPEGNAGSSAALFTVTLFPTSSATVTVNYATANGIALAGSDYTAASGTLTFAPGQTSKTVSVNVIGDTVKEPNETFTVNLSGATGAVLADVQGLGIILNDDGPVLKITDVSRAEGNAGTAVANFTVTLSPASTANVTVTYATANGSALAGSDYTPVGGTLTFAPGQTSKTIAVNLTGDTLVEPNETYTVNLSAPTGATLFDNQGLGTILNDDGPVLKISDVSRAEGNAGTSLSTFTVTLTPASAATVTVKYITVNGTALAGSDYTATSGTLTFAAGQTSKTVAVTVTGDTAVEANETYAVNLFGPTGATLFDSQGLGTILNDDGPVLKITDVSRAEGNTGSSPSTFTVTLTPASTGTVTVKYATANGTAQAGSDYTAASGTLTFAPGQTSKPVAVQVIGDTLVEPNETFLVNLSAATGASLFDSQGLGTITNDD